MRKKHVDPELNANLLQDIIIKIYLLLVLWEELRVTGRYTVSL